MVEQELKKEEQTLKDLKEQDFLDGDIYGNGQDVAYRSKNYEIFKSKKNPLAGGSVDLILTGKFVNAMFLKSQMKGKYFFGNRDSKAKMLANKYGNDIFGLNQKVFSKFQKDIIKNRFIRQIKQRLNV